MINISARFWVYRKRRKEKERGRREREREKERQREKEQEAPKGYMRVERKKRRFF